MRSRRTLLEEELAVNPIRIADEHVGTAASAAKRALCDREVVPREVQFREPRAGKEDLSWIRDRDAASRDCQDLLLDLGRHDLTIPGRTIARDGPGTDHRCGGLFRSQ